MGGTTTNFALRYPTASDPANVPSDMQNLASDVDSALLHPDMTYRGDYVGTTTYNDGDIIVGPDGVIYLCVKNGTVGSSPAPFGAGFGGVPTPAVNGQWNKGVGGAAVWAAITPADIAGYPADGTKYLAGNGTWKVPLGTVRLWGSGAGNGSFTGTVTLLSGVSVPATGTWEMGWGGFFASGASGGFVTATLLRNGSQLGSQITNFGSGPADLVFRVALTAGDTLSMTGTWSAANTGGVTNPFITGVQVA